ncbi:hypothetical protein K3727_06485 [Rhodobacteraceae bacterium M382]|nr:hypothetical protein K3727_06485 [Rhodobacteraceae bacterium M382]
MATITVNSELRLSSLENWDGDLLAATATQIRFSDGFRSETYGGSFTYSPTGDVFGTLRSYSEFRGGVLFYSITGMSVDANAVYRAVEINDNLFEAASLMLADADQITGSTTGSDELPGLGGNDTINGLGGNDTLDGGIGDDRLDGGSGNDLLIGGSGTDTAVFSVAFADVTATATSSGFQISFGSETDDIRGVEFFQFSDQRVAAGDLIPEPTDPPVDRVGTAAADALSGNSGNDRLVGEGGNDTLDGGPGADTLNGGDGDDRIIGGPAAGDLRDVIYAGGGNDNIDAGAGNDLVFGQGGNDTIAGGAGVDELQGQEGDDVITGSAFSDLVFGGAGNDFVNGGFGHDRINGGSGADKFFHIGIADHGSDWVQDYVAADGDVLLWGGAAATASDFQVNLAHTANAAGERSGDDAVQEAFVIYKPTEQIIWALVDGGGQSSINIQIGGDVFDLLA